MINLCISCAIYKKMSKNSLYLNRKRRNKKENSLEKMINPCFLKKDLLKNKKKICGTRKLR